MNTVISSKGLYDIRYEERAEYLFAYVTGETDSLDISIQFWRDVLLQARLQNYSRLLVLENFRNSIGTFDTYQLSQEMSQMQLQGQRVKIAFVDEQPDQQEMNRFGETVASNRGVVVKVFDSVPEAEEWLLG